MKKVILLFLVVLVFFGCSKKEAPGIFSEIHKESLGYLPEDSQFILYMNLNELRKSEFGKEYFESTADDTAMIGWLNEFETATGVGIESGIAEFFTAATWSNNNIWVIYIDKNFDKVKNYFNSAKQFNQIELAGEKVYTYDKNRLLRIYFAGKSKIIISNNSDYLVEIIKTKNRSVKENEDFLKIINNIKYKSHYWMATNTGGYAAALVERLAKSNGSISGSQILNTIQSITVSAKFDENVTVASDWLCKSTKDAMLLSTAMKGAIALGIFNNGNEAMNLIFKKVNIGYSSRFVDLNLSLNKNDIKELKQLTNKNLFELQL